MHEFVVIATDLAITELPTVEDGSVDEAGEGLEVIGEIEDIPVGETQSVTLDLEAGKLRLDSSTSTTPMRTRRTIRKGCAPPSRSSRPRRPGVRRRLLEQAGAAPLRPSSAARKAA